MFSPSAPSEVRSRLAVYGRSCSGLSLRLGPRLVCGRRLGDAKCAGDHGPGRGTKRSQCRNKQWFNHNKKIYCIYVYQEIVIVIIVIIYVYSFSQGKYIETSWKITVYYQLIMITWFIWISLCVSLFGLVFAMTFQVNKGLLVVLEIQVIRWEDDDASPNPYIG